MTQQPLTIQDLARLLGEFLDGKNLVPDSFPEPLIEGVRRESYGVLEELRSWLIENDTNKNPHRYPNNPDLPQELDDNGPES